jgi:hypothetical protein
LDYDLGRSAVSGNVSDQLLICHDEQLSDPATDLNVFSSQNFEIQAHVASAEIIAGQPFDVSAKVDGGFRHIAKKPHQTVQSFRCIQRPLMDSIEHRINPFLRLLAADHLLRQQLDLTQSITQIIVQTPGDADPFAQNSLQSPNIGTPPVSTDLIRYPKAQVSKLLYTLPYTAWLSCVKQITTTEHLPEEK